jgi:UDP-N-acetylmuramate dehydrogenase
MSQAAALQTHVSLADYTAWRVGGPAERLYCPRDRDDLASFLNQLPKDEPLFFLGLGSNLLIRDGGLRGTTVLMRGQLNHIELKEPTLLYAEAGVASAQTARFAARQGLTDVAFLAGIPGTIGGALAMNAGCMGGETWQWIEAVDTVDRQGVIRHRPVNDFVPHYRYVECPAEEWFLAAYFRLTPGSKDEALERIRQHLAHRTATQPTHLPNCGSVFRNPPGNAAGRLIESCGLKGYRIGDAEVSEKHANFILNLGQATAKNIENLITHVQHTVLEKTGVALEREVHIVGEQS